MSKKRKLLEQILSGSKNISFRDMASLIEAFGFALSRINGSHHIFVHPDIPERVIFRTTKEKKIPIRSVNS